MAFGIFKKKKKKELIDPTQVEVNQLVKGAFIDYDLKSWEVNAVYEYDWGDDYFADEFRLTTVDEECYLYVEEDDGLECNITQKISVHDIDEDVVDYIIRHEEPPMRINYQGTTYYRQSESVGYFRDTGKDGENWQELVSWSYYDKPQKQIINIEQWGEREFEASHGKVVQSFEITNILPATV